MLRVLGVLCRSSCQCSQRLCRQHCSFCQYPQYFGRRYRNAIGAGSTKYSRYSENKRSVKCTGGICEIHSVRRETGHPITLILLLWERLEFRTSVPMLLTSCDTIYGMRCTQWHLIYYNSKALSFHLLIEARSFFSARFFCSTGRLPVANSFFFGTMWSRACRKWFTFGTLSSPFGGSKRRATIAPLAGLYLVSVVLTIYFMDCFFRTKK